MTTWQLFASTWNWQPTVLVGCAALVVGYLAAQRLRLSKRAWFFLAGVLVLLLALVSPLDTLSDAYLFSAHMLQHLLLLLVVPPLLLSGIPASVMRPVVERNSLRRLEHTLGRLPVAWLLGIGMIWVWHLPALYNATLENESIHVVEHLCFLASATIFWWPVVAPPAEHRPGPPAIVLYLFAAMVASSVLGIILTFAPPGLYPAYLHPKDTLGILPLLRESWGLSPAVDQQVAGLLMWVPGTLIYLCAILGTLARWYSSPENDVTASAVTQVDLIAEEAEARRNLSRPPALSATNTYQRSKSNAA